MHTNKDALFATSDEIVAVIAAITKRLQTHGGGREINGEGALMPIIMNDIRGGQIVGNLSAIESRLELIEQSLDMISDALDVNTDTLESGVGALERIAAALEGRQAQPKAGDWDARVQAHYDQFWDIYGDPSGPYNQQSKPFDPVVRTIEGLPHGDVRDL